jgi:hypothetical protein
MPPPVMMEHAAACGVRIIDEANVDPYVFFIRR